MRFFYGRALRLTIFALIICHGCGAVQKVKSDKVIHRGIHKRALFYPVLLYPYNACSGILVAIAIPLSLPGRNVFLSYNFEANYNMPNQPGDSIPGPLQRFPGLTDDNRITGSGTADDIVVRSFDKDVSKIEIENGNSSTATSTEESVQKRSVVDDSVVLTRKGVYRILESRLSANGIDGKKCLLLAICESSANSLLDINGVLGHILHIILTPSTSANENLPSEYFRAEKLGLTNSCQKYKNFCAFSLLNAMSKLI